MPKRLPEMLCRWNAFEPMLRDALHTYATGEVTAERTLAAIDAYQAAATGRGSLLIHIDGEWERACWDSYERHLHLSHPDDKRFAS